MRGVIESRQRLPAYCTSIPDDGEGQVRLGAGLD